MSVLKTLDFWLLCAGLPVSLLGEGQMDGSMIPCGNWMFDSTTFGVRDIGQLFANNCGENCTGLFLFSRPKIFSMLCWRTTPRASRICL